MMRSVWIAISTMAVANLLALLAFAFWLHSSGRLSRERIERVRTTFASTVAFEQAERDRAAADEQAVLAAQAEAAKAGTPPLTAEQRLGGESARDEIEAQQARRVQRETADLINTLLREREELDRQREEFQVQVDAFERMRRRIAEEEGSEQFQKAVQVYQTVKAAEAKNMMNSLIASGQKDQVVSYLNALSPRIASKIVAEFEKDDPDLAAELLERLRLRGTSVAVDGAQTGKPVAAKPAEGP